MPEEVYNKLLENANFFNCLKKFPERSGLFDLILDKLALTFSQFILLPVYCL